MLFVSLTLHLQWHKIYPYFQNSNFKPKLSKSIYRPEGVTQAQLYFTTGIKVTFSLENLELLKIRCLSRSKFQPPVFCYSYGEIVVSAPFLQVNLHIRHISTLPTWEIKNIIYCRRDGHLKFHNVCVTWEVCISLNLCNY